MPRADTVARAYASAVRAYGSRRRRYRCTTEWRSAVDLPAHRGEVQDPTDPGGHRDAAAREPPAAQATARLTPPQRRKQRDGGDEAGRVLAVRDRGAEME